MNGQSADSVFSSRLTKEGNSFVITLITHRKEKQTDCLQDVQMASVDLFGLKQAGLLSLVCFLSQESDSSNVPVTR